MYSSPGLLFISKYLLASMSQMTFLRPALPQCHSALKLAGCTKTQSSETVNQNKPLFNCSYQLFCPSNKKMINTLFQVLESPCFFPPRQPLCLLFPLFGKFFLTILSRYFYLCRLWLIDIALRKISLTSPKSISLHICVTNMY